jgi:hypothetical protein
MFNNRLSTPLRCTFASPNGTNQIDTKTKFNVQLKTKRNMKTLRNKVHLIANLEQNSEVKEISREKR